MVTVSSTTLTSRPRQRSASTAAMWKPMRMTIATPTQKKMRAALHGWQPACRYNVRDMRRLTLTAKSGR